jgi:hypothetical protein
MINSYVYQAIRYVFRAFSYALPAWYLPGIARMRRKSANNVLADSTVSNGFPHGDVIRISIIKLTKFLVSLLPSLAIGVLVPQEGTSATTRLDHLCAS